MRVPKAFPSVAVVVLVLVVAAPRDVQAGLLDGLIAGLAPVVGTAYHKAEINLLDNYCNLERSPYIKRLQVYYRAQVTCPGWTTIKGTGNNNRNPANSENDAIKDFMRQAVAKGLVTGDEASPWLH